MGTIMFGALHCHSHFSFLTGGSSPRELAERARVLGHDFLCVTDRMGMSGAVQVQQACRRAGIRPIIGAEVDVEGASLVLIARNAEGYANLSTLLTIALQRDRDNPVVSLEDCRVFRDDIVCLTGGRGGRLWRHAHARDNAAMKEWLLALRDVFFDELYVELIHHRRPGDIGIAARMHAVATDLELPCVIGGDVRYACADDYVIHDVMTCIRHGITVFDTHRDRPVNDEQRLKTESELRKLLPFPDAFEAMSKLAERCSMDVLREEITPPAAGVSEGETAPDVLRKRCEEAFCKRYGDGRGYEAQRTTMEHELDVIGDMELADFFLVVAQIVDAAKGMGIRCSGRGSAANSIVAFLLGITGVDPVEHKLTFERFLHHGRVGTPDIDVDFDTERRHEVIAWIENHYGISHTAMTATYQTYSLRMAVRDVAKALGWPHETVTRMSKAMPGHRRKPTAEYRDELVAVVGDSPLLATLLRVAERLMRRPRHLGQHNGGMILSHRPLHTLTPVQISANGVRIAQFDKDDIEEMGLVKLDVLGLRMLACIAETLELIQRHEGKTVDIDEIALDDPEIYGMLQAGETLGVFQVESQGQMHLLAQHQPENFFDILTEIALFRPGPLQGGTVNPYVRRRRGLDPVTYLHPILEPILRDTLGVLVFQEQVLEIIHAVGAMPLRDAEKARSTISKNKDTEAIEHVRERFMLGAASQGVDSQSAERIWEKVRVFTGYGFCRSHAAAFAKTVFQSAWLKKHHPAAYMAAFLQCRPGFYNLMTLQEEARRLGVEVRTPDINRSWFRYELEKDEDGTLAIRKPLTAIAHCTTDIARSILWARLMGPFTSVDDFVRRTDIPKDTMDAIAMSGALDGISNSSRTALWEAGVAMRRRDKEHEARQTSLFDLPLVDDEDIPILPPMTAPERLAADYVTHGSARIHPMTLYRRVLNDLEVRSIGTCYRLQGGEIMTAGIVILRQSPPTANGVLFVTIEDETGFVQCVVPPKMRERFYSELRNAALIVRARVHALANWRGLLVTDVRPLNGIIGGYYGHPAMYGGTDTMELNTEHAEPRRTDDVPIDEASIGS